MRHSHQVRCGVCCVWLALLMVVSRRLYCDGNKLTSLPPAVARLTRLEVYVLFDRCCVTFLM